MIKIGVIGGGLNSAVGKAHLAAIGMTYRCQIVTASFSRDDSTNLQTANFVNLSEKHIYHDYKELIDNHSNELDFLVILTPTNQHKEQVIYALNRNINVICEKALTQSLDDAFDIEKALASSKAKLYVIYNYLGYPMIKELRSMISMNKLGKIFSIQVEMPQEGFIKMNHGQVITPQGWRLKDEFIPTISLDLGVHLHMMIHYLISSKPKSVYAISNSRGNFANIIDDINAIIDYHGDLTCNMWFSKAALGHRNGLKIRIYGTSGSAFWEQIYPEKLIYNTVEGEMQFLDRNSPGIKVANSNRYNLFKGGHPAGFVEALSNYYNDIFDFHKSKIDSTDISLNEVFGLTESIEGLKLFEAIAKSSIQKTLVKL